MDMITLLTTNGIRVYRYGEGVREKHLRSSGTWVQMVCPICGTDHLWLGYNVAHDYFNCYNHGHVTKYDLFRAWFPHIRTRELLEQLDTPVSGVYKYEEPTGVYSPPAPVRNLLDFKRHCAYVRSRGLNPEEMAKVWGWGAVPADGEFFYRDRLFFPVCNRDGYPSSWQTRTILQNEVHRYLTAPKDREEDPIKTLLYGEHLVNPFKTVIVCEGVFDAAAIGKNAVATFGKKLTANQVLKLSWYPKRIICFDGEEEAQNDAKELATRLSKFKGITHRVELDFGSDPASVPKHEIELLHRFAESL